MFFSIHFRFSNCFTMANHGQPPEGLVDPDPEALLGQKSPKIPRVSQPLSGSNESTSLSNRPAPSTTSSGPRFSTSGTSSRQKIYLLEEFPVSELPVTKLPKIKSVMKFFFHSLLLKEDLQKHSNPLTLATKTAVGKAARETADAIRSVWRYHFGIRLIDGKDTKNGQVDTSKIMIIGDKEIAGKIVNIFSEWKNCERLSRRPDRATLLVAKEDSFKQKLDMPLNILKVKGEDILRDKGGITDWQEELQHLRNQLTAEQPGTCDGYDMRQKRRDERKLKVENNLQSERLKLQRKIKEEEHQRNEVFKSSVKDFNDDEVDDDDFVAPKDRKKKIDVMGQIARTADARGLSIRDRTAIAASVASSLGVDLEDTNISVSNAHEKAKKERIILSKTVKENFVCPARAALHWDGKTLKIKGNKKSGRVCVYLSGVDNDKIKKLLAVPEAMSATGKAEAEAVKKVLMDWQIKEQVVSVVFDTTASNSSGEVGACFHLETFVDSPVLWTACRHHIYELHIKKVTETVTGQTKDPGVDLFRRLKSEWHDLEIDYSNLVLFDYEKVPDWMAEEAKSVLRWGEEHLASGTWPREDYREFLTLVVVSLGGVIPNFRFRLPGPDHHARWMSKGIYVIKIRLLSNVFKLTEGENENIRRIFLFTVVIYAKAWLTSALSTSAARNDLTFHLNVLRYRELEPSVAFKVLQSIRNHGWYLSGQLVTLALADIELDDDEKEEMAKTLHSIPRVPIQPGKPEFPVLDWRNETLRRPRLSSLITPVSWLIFDILDLSGPQDWLQLPSHMWSMFSEYRKIVEFATNLPVVNDLAERGCHMITEYINKSSNEEQRQALLQVVEYHRTLVPNLSKKNLTKC